MKSLSQYSPSRLLPLLIVCLLTFNLPAVAQLNSSVSVEGEYLPIVIETERVNVLPEGYRFELPPANLNYDLQGLVLDFRPSLLTMGAPVNALCPEPSPRGWVDARLGSRLHSNLDAGYHVLRDSLNRLTARMRFESSTLFRTHGTPESYTRPPLKRLYDGNIGLRYTRLLSSEGRLTAAVDYRAAYFNYYGTSLPLASLAPGQETLLIPTQTLNGFRAAVGYCSSQSQLRGWHAAASFNYLAFRRLYGPEPLLPSSRGDRESHLVLTGGYAFPLFEGSAVAIDVRGDFLFYPSTQPEALHVADYSRKNYGIVSLRPAYRLHKGNLKINAGFDIDVSYDAMGWNPESKFGAFHIAPDVELAYDFPAGVGVFINAKGGVTPSTLAMREKLDRYLMPRLLSTAPLYSPIDAKIGLNIGPFAGFSSSVALRYAEMRGAPLGGWYQAFLGTYLDPAFTLDRTAYTSPWMQTVNLRGFDVELCMRYDYGTMASLSLNAVYTPQHTEEGIFNGFDRPRWAVGAEGMVKPLNWLKVNVGYEYRGVRNCYGYAAGSVENLTSFRLPDISNLYARVTCTPLKNLDVYINADNLLCRRVDILPGLQSEGLLLQGGVTVRF